MKPAIRVEGLSKRYRVGAKRRRDRNLTETLLEGGRRAWRKLRDLAAPGDGGPESESFWALRDVSFEVQPGEVVGVVGRNGAGKSTLLKILSQIVEPTAGRVEVRGRLGSLLEVGTGFHPELTGRENIYLNATILGMGRREINKKFDEIVAFSEIEQFLDTPVKRYSSGMYVRLAFAVAAHVTTNTLLIDEVLAVGDASFQKKCLGKMGEVAHQGRTILFVSHNVAAVEALCNTGILLENGRLSASGPISSILERYMQSLQSSGRLLGDGVDERAPASFRSIELLRNGVDRTETVQTGDPVTLRVMLDVRQPQKGMYLGVGLLDQWGRVVCALHSREAGLVLDETISGPLELTVELPRLLLLPGQFHVRLVAVGSDGALAEGSILQEVPSALTFNVMPRDFSGSGHSFHQGHGLALLPFRMRASSAGKSWEASVLADQA